MPGIHPPERVQYRGGVANSTQSHLLFKTGCFSFDIKVLHHSSGDGNAATVFTATYLSVQAEIRAT